MSYINARGFKTLFSGKTMLPLGDYSYNSMHWNIIYLLLGSGRDQVSCYIISIWICVVSDICRALSVENLWIID